MGSDKMTLHDAMKETEKRAKAAADLECNCFDCLTDKDEAIRTSLRLVEAATLMTEFAEECSRGPWSDSEPESLLRWTSARAKEVLARATEILSGRRDG